MARNKYYFNHGLFLHLLPFVQKIKHYSNYEYYFLVHTVRYIYRPNTLATFTEKPNNIKNGDNPLSLAVACY